MAINGCNECLAKQRRIDELNEEVRRLKEKLNYQERKQKEGFFGSSTPSAKIPVKANTAELARKPKGARPGHKGNGRKVFIEADREVDVAPATNGCCPICGGILQHKGSEQRQVVDSRPILAEKVVYTLPKDYCPGCHKTFQPSPPGVLPKSLYGNQLIVTATVMHYLHGIPMGRICEQMGVGPGALVEVFHRLARIFDCVPEKLITWYRNSWVRHADETGWRTEGKNGYAWLFATPQISIFLFRKTRSGEVARYVLGQEALPGFLVVDRYGGYNRAPCAIQYCYAHLKRAVEDLEKEFPDSPEILAFTGTLVPLLSAAMGLRNQAITDEEFYRKASEVKSSIIEAITSPATHLGIRNIQDIFQTQEKRLYHWAEDRNVPADNNLSERDLRPTVIARKVSFGSGSDAGAHTRGVLMSVLWSLKKQAQDVSSHLKMVLDEVARDMNQDPFPLLFPNAPPLSP